MNRHRGKRTEARSGTVRPALRSPRVTGLRRLASSLGRVRSSNATRRKIVYALLLAGIVIVCLAAWPFTRDHLEAIAILRQVANQPVPWIAGAPTAVGIHTEDTTLEVETPSGQQTIRARLYLPDVPGTRPHVPAMVLFHGVHHMGIDEPRLEGFAAAMASCGIRILTPELPDIKDYHVSQDSVRTIGESVKWFAARTGGPVGVMGLSFSGGLALVAAADPLYHPDFKFVLAVGSQDSLARVMQYYRTGNDLRPDGTMEILPAHEYGPLVLEYEYLEDFLPRRDLGPVRAVLRAHLYEDKAAEDNALAKLTDAQKRESAELMDTASPVMKAKINASITRHGAELAGLSPRGKLKSLSTPVYLLHGEADNIIPSAETLWMAGELPQEDLKAMLVSPVLSHLDLDGTHPTLRDQWRLIHFFALVLRAAEAK